jgi:hypothetical protein
MTECNERTIDGDAAGFWNRMVVAVYLGNSMLYSDTAMAKIPLATRK